MRSDSYRLFELLFIFILAPVSFLLEYPIWIKLAIGLLGFIYVIFILLRIEKNRFRIGSDLKWKVFWKQLVKHLFIIAAITTIYVWFTQPDKLFNVMLEKPKLWFIILIVYSLFSVYPQELIYRTFFFQRYESLFKSETLLVVINALVFSAAHLFFRNILVLVMTFIGGILFALTFKRTRSTVLVSIEHAVYGCWLFTVGMGEMLGFPA